MQPWLFSWLFGRALFNLCVKRLLGFALGREWPWIAGSLSEPVFCDFSGIVNEGFTIPGIMF